MKVDDRQQIQDKNFAQLKEMVEQFEAKSSTIQKSMRRIEFIFECHTIKEIEWNKVLARIKDSVDAGEISKLETTLIDLIYFCKYYTE